MKYGNSVKLNLSPKQQEIVSFDRYPIYVTSGAGCGKTQTLVTKVLEIFNGNDNIDLNNIIVITFTNKAAEEMQDRLKTTLYSLWLAAVKNNDIKKAAKLKIQKQTVNVVNVSTIHAFCEMLLREYAPNIGYSSNFIVSSYKSKSNEIISGIVREYIKKGIVSGITKNNLYKLVSKLYWDNDNKGVGKLKYKDTDAFKAALVDIYNKVWGTIESQKQSDNILTPNDLISKTTELLEINTVCENIGNQYKFLLMDEFQDTNFIQFKLTEKLLKTGIKIFLVGDERQSIYAFRGADVENVKRAKKFIGKNAGYFELSENYRSDPALINYFNELFRKPIKHNDTLLHFNKDKLAVSNASGSSEEKAINFVYEIDIVKIIETLVNHKTIEGRPIEYKDISILCRKNYMVDEIGKTLKNAGIPTEIIGGHGFYKAKEVIDIFKFFNYLVNKCSENYAVLLYTDFYNAYVQNHNTAFKEFMSDCMEIAKTSDAAETMDYLYENSGLYGYYEKNNNYQAIANIIKLKDVVREYTDNEFSPPARFLDILNIRTAASAEEDEAPVSEEYRQKGVVSVYTIHKAKGLTMPVVVLSGIDDNLINKNNIPDIIADTSGKNVKLAINNEVFDEEVEKDNQYVTMKDEFIIKSLEEELRVLYVALTRAKHMIVLSSRKSKESALESENTSWLKWIQREEVENK